MQEFAEFLYAHFCFNDGWLQQRRERGYIRIGKHKVVEDEV